MVQDMFMTFAAISQNADVKEAHLHANITSTILPQPAQQMSIKSVCIHCITSASANLDVFLQQTQSSSFDDTWGHITLGIAEADRLPSRRIHMEPRHQPEFFFVTTDTISNVWSGAPESRIRGPACAFAFWVGKGGGVSAKKQSETGPAAVHSSMASPSRLCGRLRKIPASLFEAPSMGWQEEA
jgi:hypothetical protein